MSDTILAGDITVHYAADGNQKRLEWTGSAVGSRTLNELYSALQSLFDDAAQMDDKVPMKADTPDIYRLQNQWFIDDTTVEHLKGGSLFSSDWVSGSDEHVLVIGYAQSAEFTPEDIGRTVLGGTTADTGTILDFNTARALLWIRPDDPATAGDEFDNGTEAYTIPASPLGAAMVDDAGVFTDETVDANSAGNADFLPFPAAEATGDRIAIGFRQPFGKVTFDNLNGTQGVGGVVTWEYWNGTVWGSLAGVTDGTSGFTAAVADGQDLTFTVPADWAARTQGASPSLFFIRADITNVYSTNPVYDQAFIGAIGAGSFVDHGRHGTASAPGESAWAGMNSIGSIQANTHIYVFQQDPDGFDSSSETREILVTSTKGATDWWEDGQIDILLKVKEANSIFGRLPASAPATGIATILARQYTKLYSHFIATALATAGGNTVVPLSTGNDLDNIAGNREMVLTDAASGPLVVDEVIEDDTDPTIQGVITSVSGSEPNLTIRYYLIGDPLTDFTGATGTFTGSVSGGTATAVAPTDVGPATSPDNTVTVVLGQTTEDINNGNGARPYSVRIDPTGSQVPIARVYERLKFITRRGSATAITIGDHIQEGQEYIGDEIQLEYNTQAGGNFVQGQMVFDQTAKGVGIVVADHDDGATGDLILRAKRGTFLATNVVSDTPAATIPLQAALHDNGGVFTDETVDAQDAGTADVAIFSEPDATSDAFYIGANDVFGTISVDNTGGTAGTSGVVAWEYWDGSSWVAIPGLTDGTTSFTAAVGVNLVTFAPPSDWTARTVGAGTSGANIRGPHYYVRARITTTYTILPIADIILLLDFVTATIGTVRSISPVNAAPFGTFAGGKFFGAPGVALTISNLAAGEDQSFQLIDDDGTVQIPPNTVTVSVTNLVSGDTVTMFRRTGLVINKTQFALAAGNDQGDATVVVDASISADNPTNAGSKIRVISASGEEDRYRYASYTSVTFTLDAAKTGTGTSGSTTNLTDTGATFTTAPAVEVGDMIRNTADNLVSRVTAVNSATSIDVTDNGTTWNGKTYTINTLVESYPTGNNAYVPLIERIADAANEDNKLVQSVGVDVRVDVRNAGVILPFTQDAAVGASGLTVPAIRSADDIFT